jgi:hypothetical protein
MLQKIEFHQHEPSSATIPFISVTDAGDGPEVGFLK